MLIVFEGVDGSGKTFTIKQIQKKISKKYLKQFVFLKEPLSLEFNGTNFTNFILNFNLDILSEFYFFMGMRVLGYYKDLLPALNKNKIVVYDRYYYSSLVYQSIPNEDKHLTIDFLEDIVHKSIDQLDTDKKTKNKILNPDIIFIFVSDYKEGIFRKHIQNEVNKFEKRGHEYYNKLTENYVNLFKKIKIQNKSKIYFIDSNQKIDTIIDYCFKIIINSIKNKI